MSSEKNPLQFSGASKYVLDDELAKIVNVSMALEMPLLLKGEPGTGKNHAGPRHRRKPPDGSDRPECEVEHEAH